jgi:hypothetical protein
LGAKQWGLGPTAVALQQSPVRGQVRTVGFLVNQLWGVSGNNDRPYLNNFFFQPFYGITNKTGMTQTINIEGSYNWTASQLTLPVNLMIAQIIKNGNQLSQLQGGIRYYIARPDSGPVWGLRLNYILLFPM